MLRYFWPSDDEQLAGQWVDSHFDEDAAWWAGIQKCGATVALATLLAVTGTSTALAANVFNQHQDDPAGNLVSSAIPQEEYFQNPVAPVSWPQPTVITYDDTHVAFVEAFQADEDLWINPTPPVQASNYLRLPFLDPDEIPVGSFPSPTNPLDDGGLWAPQIPPADPDWNVVFFLDDGSWVPALQPDEDLWWPQIPPQNWASPAQPFRDDDPVVPQLPGEDVFWPSYVAPVSRTLVGPQQWAFEQNETPVLFSFTDEVYWPNPVAPVPASNWLLRQDAFEQNDATGSLFLVLDDGFEPKFVPPVPASLGLLQQWTFEQHDPGGLYAVHDEDFWQNPVRPVIWPQPSVQIADEIVEQFVQTFQPDEDFWQQLVPSVQASNFVYLPLAQEDDAPQLSVPPPPPPPPFCPLPPTGPDADVSMSVFGGRNRPLLALFCRICKSGRPLVVRADYAIWCQDCCSFVSKADTYMGTVRAPGQLKGIF